MRIEDPGTERVDPRATPAQRADTWRAAEQPPAIVFDQVGLTFRGADRTSSDVEALRSVSFSVPGDRFCAVVGPSGCGKSTLLNLTAGLARPTTGTVSVEGGPVSDLQAGIGYVTQDSNLLPWLTVEDNMALPLQIQKYSAQRQAALLSHWLSVTDLTEFRDKFPGALSGGMQKRCAIARTLIYDPPLLLMDEPFGALDAMTKTTLQAALLRLWEHDPKPALFVTHDLGEALALADVVVVMSGRPGRVEAVLPVDIPRPRDAYAVSGHPTFIRMHQELWGMFHADVGGVPA